MHAAPFVATPRGDRTGSLSGMAWDDARESMDDARSGYRSEVPVIRDLVLPNRQVTRVTKVLLAALRDVAGKGASGWVYETSWGAAGAGKFGVALGLQGGGLRLRRGDEQVIVEYGVLAFGLGTAGPQFGVSAADWDSGGVLLLGPKQSEFSPSDFDGLCAGLTVDATGVDSGGTYLTFLMLGVSAGLEGAFRRFREHAWKHAALAPWHVVDRTKEALLALETVGEMAYWLALGNPFKGLVVFAGNQFSGVPGAAGASLMFFVGQTQRAAS